MPDCLIVLGQEERANSSELTYYCLLVAHFILELFGVLRFETFNSKDLVYSIQFQLAIGVMIVGADIS